GILRITVVADDPQRTAGFEQLRRAYAVRDALHANPVLRDRSATVRKRVGATTSDLDGHGAGRTAVVRQILAVAGLSEVERAAIDAIDCADPPELTGAHFA